MARKYVKSGVYERPPEDKYYLLFGCPSNLLNGFKETHELKVFKTPEELLKRIEDRINTLFVKHYPSCEIDWRRTVLERIRVLNSQENDAEVVPQKIVLHGAVYSRHYDPRAATVQYVEKYLAKYV